MSTYLKLKPISSRGSKIIGKANYPDHWILLETKQEVSFSDREGPWLYVIPDNNNKDCACWVHATEDKNFVITEKR